MLEVTNIILRPIKSANSGYKSDTCGQRYSDPRRFIMVIYMYIYRCHFLNYFYLFYRVTSPLISQLIGYRHVHIHIATVPDLICTYMYMCLCSHGNQISYNAYIHVPGIRLTQLSCLCGLVGNQLGNSLRGFESRPRQLSIFPIIHCFALYFSLVYMYM